MHVKEVRDGGNDAFGVRTIDEQNSSVSGFQRRLRVEGF